MHSGKLCAVFDVHIYFANYSATTDWDMYTSGVGLTILGCDGGVVEGFFGGVFSGRWEREGHFWLFMMPRNRGI